MALSFLGLNPLFVSPKPVLKQRHSQKQIPAKPVAVSIPSSNSKLSNSNNSETSDDDSDHSIDSLSKNQSVYLYHILTKQRNDAIKRAQQLEHYLKEYDVEIALKYDQFKHQLKQYKNTNTDLRNANIQIKNEIQELRDRIAMFDQHGNLDNLIRKRRKSNKTKHQLPTFVQRNWEKELSFDDEIIYRIDLTRAATAPELASNGLKTRDTHHRQLTTIMEHKPIPLKLLMPSESSAQTLSSDDNEW